MNVFMAGAELQENVFGHVIQAVDPTGAEEGVFYLGP